jgi:hypothetical protein
MTALVIGLLAAIWVLSIGLAIAVTLLISRPKKPRLPNWMIESLEDAMANNGRAAMDIRDVYTVLEAQREVMLNHLEDAAWSVDRQRDILGKVRGRPFDGSDRDKECN